MTLPISGSSTSRNASKGLLPRTVKGWAILILVILLVCTFFAFILARSTPRWYSPLDPSDQQVIDDADRAQRKIYLELYNSLQAVPLGEQKWTISQDEINSLIAIHFAESGAASTASANAKMPTVSDPFVVFTPGKITLAARTPKAPGSDPKGGVVSVVFKVRSTRAVDGTPAGVVKIEGLWIGSLPVPKSYAEERVQAALPRLIPLIERTLNLQLGPRKATSILPEVKDTARSIADGDPFSLEFKFDRRQVVIREIRVDEGSMTITFVPPTPTAVRPR